MNLENENFTFEAATIDPETLEKVFVDNIVHGNGGITRRTALAFLSKSSDEWCQTKMDEGSGECFLHMAENLTFYIDAIEDHLNTVRAAQARMFVVLKHHFDHEKVA